MTDIINQNSWWALIITVIMIIGAMYFAISFLVLKFKISRKISEVEERSREEAQNWLTKWRETDSQKIRENERDVAEQKAEAKFNQWVIDKEEEIRKDSVERSKAVTLGKVAEHLAPFFPGFEFNPRDAKFLGSPVDFVVFDGLTDGEVKNVVFIEVKTGSSNLSTRERKVRDAIEAGNVRWEILRPEFSPEDKEEEYDTEVVENIKIEGTIAQKSEDGLRQVKRVIIPDEKAEPASENEKKDGIENTPKRKGRLLLLAFVLAGTIALLSIVAFLIFSR